MPKELTQQGFGATAGAPATGSAAQLVDMITIPEDVARVPRATLGASRQRGPAGPAKQPPGSTPVAAVMTPGVFRELFPALTQQAWLDTPASAPGATPVTSALTSAITSWQDGSLGAADWERAAPQARAGFARYLGVPEAHVALMGSVAEAAATVPHHCPAGAAPSWSVIASSAATCFPGSPWRPGDTGSSGFPPAAPDAQTPCWPPSMSKRH
jgi:hypothetical protein